MINLNKQLIKINNYSKLIYRCYFNIKYLIIIYLILTSIDLHATSNNTPVANHGSLQVIGTQLCDEKGEAVSLQGVSLGWHNLWPRFYNKKAVDWLVKDWNISVIQRRCSH